MNVVVWIQDTDSANGGLALLNPALNNLARIYGQLNIIGYIAPPNTNINGLKNISKQDLKKLPYDLILVSGGLNASLLPVLKESEILGIDAYKVVLDRTVCIPLFTLEKYNKLRKSKLTIFSRDCFGGIIYNRLGLPFLSPTINMAASEEDFIKFLENPIEIIRKQLIFQRTELEPTLKINYPVFKIGDIEWHMNHYPNFDEAFKKWYERSYRINWFNTFVVMSTDKVEFLEAFDKLPYPKKLCFVPFETDLESGFYLDQSQYDGESLCKLAHYTAIGKIVLYDIWDMLLYGKKTLLKSVPNR